MSERESSARMNVDDEKKQKSRRVPPGTKHPETAKFPGPSPKEKEKRKRESTPIYTKNKRKNSLVKIN